MAGGQRAKETEAGGKIRQSAAYLYGHFGFWFLVLALMGMEKRSDMIWYTFKINLAALRRMDWR